MNGYEKENDETKEMNKNVKINYILTKMYKTLMYTIKLCTHVTY